jgi:hypothetical protein
LGWAKDYGALLLTIGSFIVMVGVYKNTVDDLKDRVAKLEAAPRQILNSVDPRAVECARLARAAYGDGTRLSLDDNTNILMLRLGCDTK